MSKQTLKTHTTQLKELIEKSEYKGRVWININFYCNSGYWYCAGRIFLDGWHLASCTLYHNTKRQAKALVCDVFLGQLYRHGFVHQCRSGQEPSTVSPPLIQFSDTDIDRYSRLFNHLSSKQVPQPLSIRKRQSDWHTLSYTQKRQRLYKEMEDYWNCDPRKCPQ